MSDEPKSKVRVVGLLVILAIAAGLIVFQLTNKPAALPDSTAEKANRLTQKAAELEDKQRATEVELPPEPGVSGGPKDLRGGGGVADD